MMGAIYRLTKVPAMSQPHKLGLLFSGVVLTMGIALFAEDGVEVMAPEPPYEFWSVFFKMVFLLGGILGALLIASWVIRKIFEKRNGLYSSQQRIEVLERRSLHAKATLYLLRIDDQEILAAETPHGLRRLAHWTQPSNDSSKAIRL